MHNVEPFYGWLELYDNANDERSPFYEVEHNLFHFDRAIYNYCAHPLWDEIGSESLLVKILFADYDRGFAIVELLGEWNDLLQNDFKLMVENCLSFLVDHGIQKFILIAENVFNIYLEEDDYYEAFQDELEEGWICLLRPREHVIRELSQYGIDAYLFNSPMLEELHWRKVPPAKLFQIVDECITRPMLT